MNTDGRKTRLGTIIILAVIAVILACLGMQGWASEGPKIKLDKFNFDKYYRYIEDKGNIEIVKPTAEREIILIKGEVLSLGATYSGLDSSVGESFVYVHNQGEIGDDVAVCFIPPGVSPVFRSAMENDYKIFAWGFEIGVPPIYQGVTTKGFVILAARVCRPDVQDNFKDVGMFTDLMLGGGKAKLIQ